MKLNINLNLFQIFNIYNKIKVVEQISLPGFDSSGYGSVDCTKRFKTSGFDLAPYKWKWSD